MNEDERFAQAFYEDLEGGRLGLFSLVARTVFDVSGYFYAGNLLRSAGLRPRDRVLEVGCGAASILIRAHGLRDSTRRYYGVDVCLTMLGRARENIKRRDLSGWVSIAAAPASCLPFKDRSFDMVLLAYVIKHLSDETFASSLREAYRVLLPGGHLVMWEFLPSPIPWINNRLYSITKARRLRGYEEIVSFLAEASFTNPERFSIFAPWLPTRTLAVVATK